MRRRRGGFALLITITLLAFLVLLLVSLASLTRVETQVANNNQQIAQARQNALMALNLALGQLQRHAGPDQRVTATADLQPVATAPNPLTYPVADPASGQSLTAATATALGNINTYWNGRRNRHWVGAWANNNNNYDKDSPAEGNPIASLQGWLVSGNETVSNRFQPMDTLPSLSLSATPLDKIPDSTGLADRNHRILVKAAAGVVNAADLPRIVTAPEVPIHGEVPGFDTPQIIGNYAWWVGDEGVKTRVDLTDPYLGETSDEARLNRFQIAQRPASEVIDTAFSSLDPANHDDSATTLASYRTGLGKALTPSQLANLDTTPAFSTALKARFHDITVSSRGVLADTKMGGLKSDLTYILSQPDVTALQNTLKAAYDNPNAVPSSNFNPIINTVTTRYAELPADVSGVSSYSLGLGIFGASTTWEQLWSFYNFSSSGSLGIYNSAGQASSKRPLPTQHAIHPLLVHAKLFYGLRIEGGFIHVDTMPLVVLANPYAVDLAPYHYQVMINNSTPPALRFGNVDTSENVDDDFSERVMSGTEPNYHGRIRLRLKSNGIPAGEARVFTLDPEAPNLVNGRFLVTGTNDGRIVDMIPEWNPIPSLTYNTGKPMKEGFTRVALRAKVGQLNTYLYLDNDGDAPDENQHLVQFLRFQRVLNDPQDKAFFLVNPMSATDSERPGGGYIMSVMHAPSKQFSVAAPSIFSYLQAPFSQMNYRSMLSTNSGTTEGGLQSLVETARAFTKNGSASPLSDWFAANLFFKNGSFSDVRWGVANIGVGQAQTELPDALKGSADVGFKNLLYDVPRPGHPLRSLGQLQHLSPTGYSQPGVKDNELINNSNPAPSDARRAVAINNWQMNYPVSNSYPHPRVRREQVFGALPEHGYHYDGSYLWNHVFWDKFHFSTFPQAGSFDFSDPLPNSRYRPFRDPSVAPWDETSLYRGDNDTNTPANSRMAAKNLLLDGAFNINSTSVEAWKALFSSLRNVQVGTHSGTSAPFSRTLTPTGGTDTAGTRGSSPESWNGYRDLSANEIQTLAEEMVMEVRKRGPFLSLADFVNRRLVTGRNTSAANPSIDPLRVGLAGALQAALDRSVNLDDDIDPEFRRQQARKFVREVNGKNNEQHNGMRDADYRMSHGLVGYPGHVMQGDVLSSLGASLSARSDTFIIRTYGDSVNPATGVPIGRAWCEAIVQRLPDYVLPETAGGNAATDINSLHPDNQNFGRRFQIISFRWLSPEDV